MQLPENEENIVEDQPTEAVDSDADDNENQEDFSEEIEDPYYYCFHDEGCHIIYHRFLPADYKDFDF